MEILFLLLALIIMGIILGAGFPAIWLSTKITKAKNVTKRQKILIGIIWVVTFIGLWVTLASKYDGRVFAEAVCGLNVLLAVPILKFMSKEKWGKALLAALLYGAIDIAIIFVLGISIFFVLAAAGATFGFS